MRAPAELPLYWRVVLTNGLVFVLGPWIFDFRLDQLPAWVK